MSTIRRPILIPLLVLAVFCLTLTQVLAAPLAWPVMLAIGEASNDLKPVSSSQQFGHLTPQDDVLDQPGWWDEKWDFRLPIVVESGVYQRTDKPAETVLDINQILDDLDVTEPLDEDSLRLVEIDGSGKVVEENVPFQFDSLPSGKANFVWLMKGTTTAGSTRQYHLYFEVEGAEDFSPQPVAKHVVVKDDVPDAGFNSVRVTTDTADYYYHKDGGGFSSLIDNDGSDWISYSEAAGTAGDFRGIPNLVAPDDGGFFHPGRTGVNTQVVTNGPLKASLLSETKNGKWQTLWDIYPTYAKLTVQKAPDDTGYWFLYEGTLDGEVETDKDFVVRADGTKTSVTQEWEKDIEPEEWAYFFKEDQNSERSLFMVHHEDDEILDSFRLPKDNGMTIFGFGRHFGTVVGLMHGSDQHFTIGLVDEEGFGGVKRAVRAAYKDMSITTGAPERREYNLAATVEGTGSVEVLPQKPTYVFGDVVSLEATTTEAGWSFEEWTGDTTGTESKISIKIEDDTSVTAVFSHEGYKLQVETTGQGQVTKSPDQSRYEEGEVVTLEAMPENEWVFDRWSGDVTGSKPIKQLKVTDNHTVEAHFVRPGHYLPVVISR